MAAEKCAELGCKEPARVEGWCMKHRYGVCETPQCGRQAIGRIALAKNETVQTMSGPQIITRYVGSPFICQECHDKIVVTQKHQAGAIGDYLAELTKEEKPKAKVA